MSVDMQGYSLCHAARCMLCVVVHRRSRDDVEGCRGIDYYPRSRFFDDGAAWYTEPHCAEPALPPGAYACVYVCAHTVARTVAHVIARI